MHASGEYEDVTVDGFEKNDLATMSGNAGSRKAGHLIHWTAIHHRAELVKVREP
jgi:hypothetical protein